MKKYIIIKTGDTFDWIKKEIGDFEDWFIKVMGIDPALIRIVNVPKGDALPKPDEFKGVIITGSHAMITENPSWSMSIEKWLPQLIVSKIPVLGICYGHQLLARSMGGVVDYHPKGVEVGTPGIKCLAPASSDPLFKYMPKEFPAHVSHSQSVVQLPEGAVLLAENDFESHHAFRIGECAWGLQFHPEFDEQIMTMYARNMKKSITDANRDLEDILSGIKPTPDASKILKRFVELVRDKK